MTQTKAGGTFLTSLRRLFVPGERSRVTSAALAAQERARAARTSVPVGRFSLVGLRHVREELGDRWPALAERVRDLAQSVISRHLLAGDVFELNSDGDYLVLFCQLGEREAEFKARAIAGEITRRLLGSEWGKLSAVEAVTSTVSREAAAADDLEFLLAASFANGTCFRTAGPDEADPHPAEGASARPEASLSGGKESPPPARPAVVVAAGAPRPQRPLGVAVPIGRQSSGWVYAPIWDFNQNALIHFRIVPAGRPAGTGLTGAALQQADFSEDVAALRKAIGDIVRLAGLSRRLPVTCPVRGSALEVPARRRELLDELRALPPHVVRLLTLELTAPPAWARSGAVDQFIEAVRNLKARVCARLPANAESLAALADQPGPVTLQLPAKPLPESSCIKYLGAFADRALKAQLECGVAGVATRSLAMAASAAGYRYLSGPAIHAEIAGLDQATRFDLAKLYEDLMPGAGTI